MWSVDNLDYEGDIYRPPSEAGSIILQTTVGCAHNRCTFCASYKEKRFRIKDRSTIERDLQKAAQLYPGAERLFVADGDALIMPMQEWRWLLPSIKRHLPWVKRVGVYATGRAIRKKSDKDLRWLHDNGLGIVYLGVESGDPQTLSYIRKDSTADQLVEAGHRARAAGFSVSVTVLLGIAPPGRSLEHGQKTGLLLSAMDPDYVGVLSVIVCPGTELARLVSLGEHRVPTSLELLNELREILAHTDLSKGYFMANHASNYLPLKVAMPLGKAQALARLDSAIQGKVPLRPEFFRAL